MHVGHDGLVHATVPLDVSGLAVSVSVHVLVVLMVHGVLASAPFTVCIRYWRVLGENASAVPEEKVGVIHQGLGVHRVVVHYDGSVVSKTSTVSSEDEVSDPCVRKTNTHVEGLDGELTDGEETEHASELGTRSIVGPVEIGTVNGSGDLSHLSSGEPVVDDVQVLDGLVSP